MKRIFSLATLLLTLCALNAAAATIAVYHTSDIHGWYSARPAAWDNDNPKRLIGGFAALAAHLRRETTPYILLDSGDMFQGTPEGILTRGLASAVLMNQLGYAAAAPGNHDFDFGEESLKTIAAGASFPLLAANIYLKDGGARPAYLKPYIVIEKGGKKIAVLGLAGRHTATSTRPENVKHLDFRPEPEEAAKWLPELRKLAPDAVIALAHLGLDEAISLKRLDVSTWTFAPQMANTLDIVRAAHGIDLLLGGHDHTSLVRGYRDPVSGAWLAESGYGLSYVTRAELTFDDADGKLKEIKVESLPLWIDQTGQDPAVLASVTAFSAQAEAAMGKVVGRAAADLNFSPEGLDSGVGNLLCDLTRQAAGTDMAFHNTKAIRIELKKGPVELRHLYQAMPFDNNVITMRLNGAELRRLMEDNLVNGYAFIQVSGLQVEFTPGAERKPAYIRLTRGGREIKPEDEFTVATNDYMAFGGNGGDAFAGGRDIKNTMLPVRDLLIKAFQKGPVKPPRGGRIKRLK